MFDIVFNLGVYKERQKFEAAQMPIEITFRDCVAILQ